MDAAKLAELRRIDFRIAAQCGLCVHGLFAPGSRFGVCRIRSYDHAKHGNRPLSIHIGGSCSEFELSEAGARELGDWREFLRLDVWGRR